METMISVLLPTRNRTALAHQSIASLFEHSANPAGVEIVIAYDMDDTSSADYFTSQEWHDNVKNWGGHCQILQCPTWGYWHLNRYYNAMALQARGQWFMIWNDDAVMKTFGWDQHIEANKDFVGMLHMTTQNFKPHLTLFPIIPKVWLELFGEISHTQITDTWIQNICNEADAVRDIPVEVFHDRYDVTGNNLDQTYLDRKYNKKEFNHELMEQLRSQWAQRLRHHREHNAACDAKPRQT